MRNKDTIILEQAYQTILEAKTPPCPCTTGKKCTKKECPCPKCKKAKAKLMKEDSGEDESLSDPVLQKGMAILNQYAQGDITNKEAALMFKDLYEKGVNSGPSQDDMYYTTLNPRG